MHISKFFSQINHPSQHSTILKRCQNNIETGRFTNQFTNQWQPVFGHQVELIPLSCPSSTWEHHGGQWSWLKLNHLKVAAWCWVNHGKSM